MHINLTATSPFASLFELNSIIFTFRIDLTCALKMNILLNIHFELIAVIDVYEERPPPLLVPIPASPPSLRLRFPIRSLTIL